MASKAVYSVVAVVGIAAASGAAWWYQSRPTGPKEITGAPASAASAPAGGASAPRAAGVEVAKVEKMSLQDDAQSVGSLRSRQSVMMRPEVAGRVMSLGFTDGGRVRKGQVLVQLDDVLQRAEIRQAQAQVSIAQANLKRNQELVAQNFVAQRVLDESAANLQVVEAQLALSCARLSRMAIIAPFDGTVGIRNVNLGDYVKDGADLINLEDISSMYVDFRLPERFQGKLRPQQSVELQLDAYPGRAFKARIEAIDPLLDANGRSVGVRAVLPNTMGEPIAQGGGGGGGRPGAAGAAGTGAAGKPADAASAAKSASAKPAAPRSPAAAAGTPARAGQLAASAPARPPTRAMVDANGCPTTDSSAANAGGQAPGNATAPRAGARPAGAGGAAATAAAGGARGAGGPGAGGGNPAPLRPGMFARVTTVFAIRDSALAVPEEAIVPQGGRQFVYKVVDAPATPAAGSPPLPADTKFVSLRQEVKLGVRKQGKVEITEGVAEGETVVLAGQQRLQRDGTALRIVELGRPPQSAASVPSGGASAVVSVLPASAASR